MQISIKYFWWTIVLILLVFQPVFVAAGTTRMNDIQKGQIVYERSCLVCHGAKGLGDGPAAFYNAAFSASRPRDLTVGNYKFRSTGSGSLPLDQDLFRTVTNGIPGTMPSFSGLSAEQRWQVVAYIKTFYAGFQEEMPELASIPEFPIAPSADSVQRGKALYLEMDCHSCHGEQGQGEGDVALAGQLKDSTRLPISPNDLTNRTGWKNGSTARDVVRTLFTGLDGTPMPSYASQFAGQEEDAWHLANYVLSLSQSH